MRTSAASMMRSRSLAGGAAAAPETRGERPLAISTGQFARPRRRGGDSAVEKVGQTVLGHQDVERRPGGAAGTGDVLAQAVRRLGRLPRQFAAAGHRL